MENSSRPRGMNGSSQSSSIMDLLSNPLILFQVIQYLPCYSLLDLAATSKSCRDLIYQTPYVFRHLDLTSFSHVQSVGLIDRGGDTWRHSPLDENATEDDYYGRSLRVIFNYFRSKNVLLGVQTLILDGLSVTFELLSEILTSESFNVRLLSIRDVKNLNERKLMQALEYVVRPSRSDSMPRIRGLYVFNHRSPRDTVRRRMHLPPTEVLVISEGVVSSQGAQIGADWNQKSEEALHDYSGEGEKWWRRTGEMITKPPAPGWAETMAVCKGLISFDTILCNGPRHATYKNPEDRTHWYDEPTDQLPPAIATYAIGPCMNCNCAPEGMYVYGDTPVEHLPLLTPPPTQSSSLKAATRPSCFSESVSPRMLARCWSCIRHRYCVSCKAWWCEDCYEGADLVADRRYMSSQEPISQDATSYGMSSEKVKVHMNFCLELCPGNETITAESNDMGQ